MVERLGGAAQCGKTPIGQFQYSCDVMQDHDPVGRLESRRKPLPQIQGTRSQSGAVLRLLRLHHAQAGQIPRSRNLVQGRDQITTQNPLLSKPAWLCAGEAKQIERGPRTLRRSRPLRTKQQKVPERFAAYYKTEKPGVTSVTFQITARKGLTGARAPAPCPRTDRLPLAPRPR